MRLLAAALGAGSAVVSDGRWRAGFDYGARTAWDSGSPPTGHWRVVGYSHVLLARLRRTGSISRKNGRGGNYGETMVADRGDVIPRL